LLLNYKYEGVNITITDLNGKVLWKKENIKERAIDLPVKTFSAGIYLVFIKTKEHTNILKLIKTN